MGIPVKNKLCEECGGEDTPWFSGHRCRRCCNAESGRKFKAKTSFVTYTNKKSYVGQKSLAGGTNKKLTRNIKKSRIKKCTPKAIATIKLDELFYVRVWDLFPHICSECECGLGDVLSKSFVSHILTKGANNVFRHDLRNVLLLCFSCHQVYEFGDRKGMKIWVFCLSIINMLKLEYSLSKKQVGRFRL